jgi:hypothetical protein
VCSLKTFPTSSHSEYARCVSILVGQSSSVGLGCGAGPARKANSSQEPEGSRFFARPQNCGKPLPFDVTGSAPFFFQGNDDPIRPFFIVQRLAVPLIR